MDDFIIENWVVLLTSAVAIAEIIVRLTPSEKDNSIVSIIKKIVDALILNKKRGGGFH